jgi:hypothetical protein
MRRSYSRRAWAALCDPWFVAVFACRRCGALVSGDVEEVPLPDQAPAAGTRRESQPRMMPGTFAVDPEPFGPPYVPIAVDSRILVSDGSRDTIVLSPADVRGVERHRDRQRLNGCCGLDGTDGPNLVCAGCGAEIATEQSDCWVSWHDVRLEPEAVVPNGPARQTTINGV